MKASVEGQSTSAASMAPLNGLTFLLNLTWILFGIFICYKSLQIGTIYKHEIRPVTVDIKFKSTHFLLFTHTFS